jgi:hypothetical protein
MEILEYTDKLLQVKGNKLKVISRDNSQNFPKMPIEFSWSLKEGEIVLHFLHQDLLCITYHLDWKNIIKFGDSRISEFIVEFFDACSHSCKVSNEFIYFKFDYTKARIVSDCIMNSVSSMLSTYNDDFSAMRELAIINGVSSKLDPSKYSYP